MKALIQHTSRIALCLCTVALLRGTAQAQHSENALEQRADMGLTLGAKLGGGLGTSDLGGAFVSELEVGVLLPLPEPVRHSLGVFLSGQYLAPGTDGKSTADPRLPGDGILRYDVTQQELAFTLGVMYRLPLSTDLLMPYAAIGGRLYLLRTEVSASGGGESFGDSEETGASGGVYLAGGVDIFLGPGALLAELQFAYAGLDGYIMRDTNVGSLNLAVGYRLML
jgi:hypothetical protein